jgi:RimJ/RimL family protein N-acetyltransferase
MRDDTPLKPWGELVGGRLTLRTATENDLPFLQSLYVAHRRDEFAALPWPDAQKNSFLVGQFEMQRRQYEAYPSAESLVVTYDQRAVGRLFLSTSDHVLRVVDVLIDASSRGSGLGTSLMRWAQERARAIGATTLELHVEQGNHRARRLYERLGFEPGEGGGAYLPMAWRVPS